LADGVEKLVRSSAGSNIWNQGGLLCSCLLRYWTTARDQSFALYHPPDFFKQYRRRPAATRAINECEGLPDIVEKVGKQRIGERLLQIPV
jgi:hypothetical protein